MTAIPLAGEPVTTQVLRARQAHAGGQSARRPRRKAGIIPSRVKHHPRVRTSGLTSAPRLPQRAISSEVHTINYTALAGYFYLIGTALL